MSLNRTLNERVKEGLDFKREGSAVSQHISQCQAESIKINYFIILRRCHDDFETRIVEALLIKRHNITRKSTNNFLKIVRIRTLWKYLIKWMLNFLHETSKQKFPSYVIHESLFCFGLVLSTVFIYLSKFFCFSR